MEANKEAVVTVRDTAPYCVMGRMQVLEVALTGHSHQGLITEYKVGSHGRQVQEECLCPVGSCVRG